MDSGYNRELTIALFRDAHLLNRILEAQRQNDMDWYVSLCCPKQWKLKSIASHSAKPKHVRLGYMGHLTLISEDVILALGHYPPELRLILAQYAPQPDWDDYVGGRYHETKERDTSLLGGGKPSVAASGPRGAGKWRVDEADVMGTSSAMVSTNNTVRVSEVPPEMKGEFRRTSKLTRETSADFGVAPVDEDEDIDNGAGPSQVSYNILAPTSYRISINFTFSSRSTCRRRWSLQRHPYLMDPMMKTMKVVGGFPRQNLT